MLGHAATPLRGSEALVAAQRSDGVVKRQRSCMTIPGPVGTRIGHRLSGRAVLRVRSPAPRWPPTVHGPSARPRGMPGHRRGGARPGVHAWSVS
jgi:hypothetical protein